MRRLYGSLGLWAFCGLAAVGCSLSTQHGYVQSDDGSLSFRYPKEWTDVPVAPITTEWLAGVDASDQPTVDNLTRLAADDPVVVAAVLQLEAPVRDTVTITSLRRLALPTGDNAPEDDEAEPFRTLFHNTIVDDNGFEGHHMRIEVDLPEGGTATAEHLAVFDADRTRIHQVRVICESTCFADNSAVIEELFDSIRLRP